MPATKPLEEWELEYINEVYPQVGVTKIANKLNRSRPCIYKALDKLGLRNGQQKNVSEVDAIPDLGLIDLDESLVRLKELRDIQHKALINADPRNIPALSSEYRATLEEIRAIEDGDKRNDENPLAKIVESINVNLRSA